MNPEQQRIQQSVEPNSPWRQWGPYLSERQWGTVREDYSAGGDAWDYFPHDHARSRAYRWGEDGLGGFCDRQANICFALAFWNGNDPILKERLFGLTNSEGNHGEDVKEYYFYVDNTPTHSYMRWRYKYPQAAYPYEELVAVNGQRSKFDPEYELLDTGIFDGGYFDIEAEYAKATPSDLGIRLQITNRGSQTAPIAVLPTLWLRNTWTWTGEVPAGRLTQVDGQTIQLSHRDYGDRWLYCDQLDGAELELLFTDNETNFARLFDSTNPSPYVKDAFHQYLIDGDREAVNPAQTGTKAAACYHLEVPAGQTVTLQLRFCDRPQAAAFDTDFADSFSQRQQEADDFYQTLFPKLSDGDRLIQRQALAALLWSKQVYLYEVQTWLQGDAGQPPPPSPRSKGRNTNWRMFSANDVILMPDTWEYPWFAAWDWAFHCVVMALIDPEFAKQQLRLLLSDNYVSPKGQIPAYEWAFGDVNPPVQAWAAWKIYQSEKVRTGEGDREFLQQIFQRLLPNYYWWLNREDRDDKSLFQGGFLGLDNITIFNRSAPLPTGGYLEQSDGTAWMGLFSLNMLAIALELNQQGTIYDHAISSFVRQFLNIAQAMNQMGDDNLALWDETHGFYFSALRFPDDSEEQLQVYSLVGLAPMLAVLTLEPKFVHDLSDIQEVMDWAAKHHPELINSVVCTTTECSEQRHLLAIASPEQLRRLLQRLLNEDEFLSPYGIRSISKAHAQDPFVLHYRGNSFGVDYEPGESTSATFGGNSNWRGPIWFPMNYLLIESLQRYYHYLGDEFQVECPTGSGQLMTLKQVAQELSQRLVNVFRTQPDGSRPTYGDIERFQTDPHWRDLLLFHEYFHGDTGKGLGASQQTGWTALVAQLIQELNDETFYDSLGLMPSF
ncbi:glucosidase [Synechococcus elongatus IITB7]|uniref:MGH1-like glycoside hydrolase domain-containing protein n=1 Tax=Synechococcus elongatus TaxID=32046 RepID=UPI0030CAC879